MVSGQTASRKQFDAAPDKVVWRAPVEVLISDSTSGAAEVLAAAIGDNHRADLVGERTFGTAAEQKLIPIPDDGSAVILTVAYYYTPSGKAIIVDGVVPTVQVVLPTPDAPDDDAAAPAPVPPPVKQPSREDPVIKKALDLLKAGTLPKAA